MTSDWIVGIDLGTTNSLVALCDERGPRVLLDDDGAALVPSVVRYAEDGSVVVGRAAREQAVVFASRTIASSKRLMGRAFSEVGADVALHGHAIVSGPRGMASIDIGDRTIAPQEVAAEILRYLRALAERRLGTSVRRAVITVPAYFDDSQRQATRDAARLAGLEAVRIVNEPTAAALAYGIGVRDRRDQTVAVYDLGGGTFDVSILRVSGGEGEDSSVYEVLSTAGDTRLGGDDMDALIAAELRHAAGDVEDSPSLRQALRAAAEAAKIRLSAEPETVALFDLHGRHVELRLTRERFDAMVAPLVERSLECCRRALRDAGMTVAAIDQVVLVGGSTRVPAVQRAVADLFQQTPYTALDPDRVVALGAAVQGAVLSGAIREALLLDVIPLSLGIETVGGAVAKVIMRNTTVPTRATEQFSTSVDGQISVKIHVLQGERELVRDCRSLGVFHLRGIPPMPAGIPQLEVEFLVDANGILAVTAVEKRSGRRAAIQVIPTHGLSRDEVDRMERDSYEHARDDMHAHRVIDLTVNSELDLKWIGEALARVRSELEPAYVSDLEERLADLRNHIAAARRDPASVDADAFAHAKQSLDEASLRLHEVAIAASLRGAELGR